MNILDFFDHPGKKHNKDYFVNLVRVAKADNIISHSELKLLHRIGRKLGFTDPEIDSLISTAGKSEYIPPYELSKRFEQLYEIVKLTMADEVVDSNEMRLASAFAHKSGFHENEIPGLLAFLIDGIKEGKDEEDLFEVFRKERKF